MSTTRTKTNTRKSTQKTKSRIPKLAIAGSVAIIGAGSAVAINSINQAPATYDNSSVIIITGEDDQFAKDVLGELKVKSAVSKDGHSREEFYSGWPSIENCNLRQRIIRRDFGESAKLDGDNCTVLSGKFIEPYSGKSNKYNSKDEISDEIQIDHIVALADAWQKGAQKLNKNIRYQIATDPINLIAVDSGMNQQKSDGDASEWLPENIKFHCEYIARQISVKYKYQLWVTEAEYDAMAEVLETCPEQRIVRNVSDSYWAIK